MLQTGTAKEIVFTVTPERTAKAVGSGTLNVLATPVLLSFLENAAWTCAAPQLAPEETTVGTLLDVKHLSPTPVGMDVTCRAELIQTEGRRLRFRLSASDAAGLVGEGFHERAVVQADRFQKKADGKGVPSAP